MSKTEENLWKAFAGESQARNKYTFFAQVARDAGFEQIAAIFEETAANEKAHAEKIFNLLKALGDTPKNLMEAIKGETYEWKQMYPEFEKAARAEGNIEAATFFKEVAEVEEKHAERYEKLLGNVKSGEVFKKGDSVQWKCRNCGYVHTGNEAPKSCPTCGFKQSFFEMRCENY